jgi:protocatechuate 3,4-dioxygenase beta subunit
MRRAILLWLIPLCLLAQDSGGTVEGMVANASTGEAIRRATVTLRRTDGTTTSRTASSDSEGKYIFTDLEPGTYVLTADRNGFSATRYTSTIKLDRGQKSSGLVLLMTPHAVITGRVLDEEGEPVVNADVQVSTLGYMQGRKQLSRAGGANTNDLGEYRVYGLTAGRYYVSASARTSPVVTATEEYATTYYPRTTDAASAVALQVPAGAQMRNIDVTLARTRTVSVKGRIDCTIEGQKRSLSLALTPRLSMGITNLNIGSRGAVVKPDGTFEVPRVAPGSYMAMASATIDDKRYAARVPVQVGGTAVEGVNISVYPGANVTGKLKVEGRDDDLEKIPSLTVGLQPWESGGIIFGPIPKSQVKADGAFQLEDVSVDRYNFYVTGLPEGYYLKAVRSAGVDVLAQGLEINGGAAPIEVVVSPNAGALEGTVMDPRSQKPAAAATVVLVPKTVERSDLYRRLTTDADGRFHLRTIVPGDYRVYAWDDVPPYAWMDPDFMRGLETKGDPVSIPEGSPQSLQATLIVSSR